MPLRLVFAVVILAIAAPSLAQNADKEVATARSQIWAKEMAIYAGRAKGDVTYYYNNASPDYLAWTYGSAKPFRFGALAAGRKAMAGHDKEKIVTEFKDFSLHGDTAIIYYVNHRTVLPNGTPVDQTFDNIHVWVRDGSDWKVLASMSRLHDGRACTTGRKIKPSTTISSRQHSGQ